MMNYGITMGKKDLGSGREVAVSCCGKNFSLAADSNLWRVTLDEFKGQIDSQRHVRL